MSTELSTSSEITASQKRLNTYVTAGDADAPAALQNGKAELVPSKSADFKVH